MEDKVVIRVEDLKKFFKVYPDKSNSMKEKLLFWRRNRYELREVLKGVSFDVHKGEAIGLIGRNGCGKSTTLKLLTRIIYPTSGSVNITGRVSSLIELGAGFHPDMSGRENIYTNASIFGLTKKQIDERIDSIIEFSELGDYIENPVRTYSSGMYMRLAFSVAINVEADILLIDEILAVGDMNFQQKCFDKLKSIKESGTTIVIVSHSLEQIEEICDRTIWIENGHIKMDGVPKKVHEDYEEYMGKEEKSHAGGDSLNVRKFCGRQVIRHGKGQMTFTDRSRIVDDEGNLKDEFLPGENISFEGHFKNKSEDRDFCFGFKLFNSNNELCYGNNTINLKDCKYDDVSDKKFVRLSLKNVSLLPGDYFLDIEIINSDGETEDSIHEAFKFKILGQTSSSGMIEIDTDWELG